MIQYSTKAVEYSTYRDDKDRIVIVGVISIDKWYSETHWDLDSINKYKPDTLNCEKIQSKFIEDNFKLLIIAGSWCGDTKSELPKLLKVLNVCNISSDDYLLIGVGRDKIIKADISDKIMVERVPTVIILKNDEEIGRIVEYPELSWEHDIAIILGE